MKKVNKYIIRFLIATLLSFLIKLYDETFKGELFTFSFRAVAFWVFMIVFVLFVWQLSDWIYKYLINKKLRKASFKKRFRALGIVYSIFGLFVAIFFSVSYSLFDLILFNLHHYGGKYQFFDLDANVGMYMGYWAILLFRGQFYLLQHAKDKELLSEKLKKESVQSQHQALKNQIDPHFFFNSMSALTGLVYKDSDLSAEYITQLSKMYRYILDKKHGLLVKLEEELNFLEAYIFLMKIRFEENVKFTIKFNEQEKDEIKLPPNTLHMLAENAIKHNRFSEEAPLQIEFYQEKDYIIVSNNLSKREQMQEQTGIGLENINKRYQLISHKEIVVEELEETFKVYLPIIKTENDESIGNRG